MKIKISIVVIFYIILFCSCMTTKTNVGRYAETQGEEYKYSKGKQAWLFWGLIPLGRTDVKTPADGNCKIIERFNFGDLLVTDLTAGIVCLRTIKVMVKRDIPQNVINNKNEKVIPQNNSNINSNGQTQYHFEIGNDVAFKKNNKTINGKIIGINNNKAIISYSTFGMGSANPKYNSIDLEFEKLTLINKEPNAENTSQPPIDVGDYVMFKDGNTGDFIKGEITTLSQNVAFVAYPDPNNPDKIKEVGKEISQLTKIDKPVTSNNTNNQINEVKSITVGDYVLFRKLDNTPQIKGKVIKINLNMATIEYTDPANINKLREIEIDINKLIKTEK